jgi:deazaflavin-dependent oxidoreductase (nitroreductase family)
MSDQNEFNRKLIADFHATRDEAGGPLTGRPVLLLTTTGAHSGRRSTTPLMSIREGDRLLVVASNAGAPRHPDWYHNVVAHPEVTVEVGTETFAANALVLEGAEREELWRRIIARYPFFADHQAKVTRQIPLVALERHVD